MIMQDTCDTWEKGDPKMTRFRRVDVRANMNERKLTDGEKDKLKDYEKEISKKDFIDRYGKEEGESIYYATLTKMAKQHTLKICMKCQLVKLFVIKFTT